MNTGVSHGRHTITIGERIFPTKGAAKEHVRAIREAATPDAIITGADGEFLIELVKRHPDADEIAGPGIAGVTFRKNATYGEAGGLVLYVLRADGTEMAVAPNNCLSPRSRRAEVVGTFRYAIREGTIDYKRQQMAWLPEFIVCPETGGRLPTAAAEVDHVGPWTFRRILDAFSRERGIDIESVELMSRVDGDFGQELADKALERDWKEFHDLRAAYELVSPEGNELRRRRDRPEKSAS
jgi:hypothetical protein